jgi:beta-lactam-binding protein with PASTA domain
MGRRERRSGRVTLRLVAVALISLAVGSSAVVANGAVSGKSSGSRVTVPRLVGKPQSRAECALAARRLRWRFLGDRRVHSRPIVRCSGRSTVTPDPKVIAQRPRAGTRVRRGSVVVIDNECLRRVRSGLPPCL